MTKRVFLFTILAIGCGTRENATLVPVGPGDIRPDPVSHLDFGRISQDALVEAEILVETKGDVSVGCTLSVEKPVVERLGGDRQLVKCRLDSSQTGTREGSIQIRCAQEEFNLPCSLRVRARKEADDKNVLFVPSPFVYNIHSPPDDTVSATLELQDAERQLSFNYSFSVPKELAPFSTIVLSGDFGYLSDTSIAQLHRFMLSGNRLVVFCDTFFLGAVTRANALTSQHGIEIGNSEIRVQSDFDAMSHEFFVDGGLIVDDDLTDGVEKIGFALPSPLVVDRNVAEGLIQNPFNEDRSICAISQYGEGEIVVVGTGEWSLWVRQFEGRSDNYRLFRNIIAGGVRNRAADQSE